ncbi:AT-rich interactive domain-containing protein 1A-like [Ptychodera flava]|uniref:AT-rich interactive domain-containing protein 1A-like n=1 Tax=Ptychodera flava TaxID=63121 RepID=UPI00396A7B94
MAETSQGLLVRGVPLNVDECTATDRLQIHFQRTVISGPDGEVNSVYSHAGSATERAFVVVFKNGKEVVQTVLEKEKRVHKVNFDGKPVQLEVTAIPLDLQTGAVLSSRLIMADKPDQMLTQAGEQSESEGENNLRNLSQTGQQWDGYPGFTQQPGGNSTMYPPHSGNYNFAGASEAQDPNLSTTSEGSDQFTGMATPPRSLIGPGGAVRQSPSEGDFQKHEEPDPNMQYGQQQYPPGWNPYQYYQGMYQPQPQPQMPPGYPSYPHPYQQYYYPGYQQSHQPPNQQPGQSNQPGPNWAPPPNQQPGQSHQQDDSSHQLSQEVIQKYIQSFPPDQQANLQRCPPEYVTMSFHSLPPDRKEFFLRKEQPEDQNSQEKDGDEDSINIDDCTLAVTGFEIGTSAEMLEMYFENEKKSGGGQVKKSEVKDGTIFLVTYESAEVAERVINHGTHVLKNNH